MTETVAVQSPVAASTSPKKAKQTSKNTAGAKKAAASKPKSNHPPTGEMVNAAIAAIKDRKGSSLQAIKKYIAETYKVDVKKQSVFIRKYLKSAVEKNTIIQAKGIGASGRFKLAGAEAEKKVAKKPAAKKPAAGTSAKKPAAKKVTVEKKPAAKTTAAKKTAAKTSKSPSKAKKTGKAPAASPKTPKPKKVAVPKAKPAKK